MDFSSSETWLDLLVIVLGVVALVIGSYQAIKMIAHSSTKKLPVAPSSKSASPATPDSQPTKTPAKAATPEQVAPKKGSTIFDNLSKPEKLASPLAAMPDFSPPKPRPKSEETTLRCFVADQLRLESASRLVLVLKNEGPSCIYKRVSNGPHNEVTITHIQDSQRIKTLLPEYGTGSEIKFHLEADNVISRTFQFTMYYGDLQGNLFRQDISGLGKEYPIVVPAVQIT